MEEDEKMKKQSSLRKKGNEVTSLLENFLDKSHVDKIRQHLMKNSVSVMYNPAANKFA